MWKDEEISREYSEENEGRMNKNRVRQKKKKDKEGAITERRWEN